MTSLQSLRTQIDSIDAEIVQWLVSGGGEEGLGSMVERRQSVVREIGVYKCLHQLPILDPNRREEMIRSRVEWAPESHKELVQHFFEVMHEIAVMLQEERKNLQK